MENPKFTRKQYHIRKNLLHLFLNDNISLGIKRKKNIFHFFVRSFLCNILSSYAYIKLLPYFSDTIYLFNNCLNNAEKVVLTTDL